MASSPAGSVFSSAALALRIAEQGQLLWDELEDATLEIAKIRENAVFRADSPDGSRYALRIHRPGYHDDDALLAEYVWMQALREDGLATPRLIPSRHGRHCEVITAHDVRYQIDLFEWIQSSQPNVALGDGNTPTAQIAAQYRMMGDTMARTHRQSSRWTPPAGFRRHAWDAERLIGEKPFWGRFWELSLLNAAQRQLMQTVRNRLRAELDVLSTGPEDFGMIHADLMPDNVIVAGTTLYLIDFDDAGFGWYLFDIAVSLFSFSNTPHFDTILRAFVDGYRTQRPLSDEALSLLPMFIAARGTTLLGWLHSRQQAEANERAPWLVDLACQAANRWLK